MICHDVGKAEIGEDDVERILSLDEKIFWLDISMHHPTTMEPA